MRLGEAGAKGLGVFAERDYAAGSPLLIFGGPRVARKDLPTPYTDDKYLQIGPDLFLGPSGGLDDFVNHSCEPNAHLLLGRDVILLADRPIKAGEEVTFDYSTTMQDEDWSSPCHCGAPSCRGLIAERART